MDFVISFSASRKAMLCAVRLERRVSVGFSVRLQNCPACIRIERTNGTTIWTSNIDKVPKACTAPRDAVP